MNITSVSQSHPAPTIPGKTGGLELARTGLFPSPGHLGPTILEVHALVN